MKENSDKYTKFFYNYEKHTIIVRSGNLGGLNSTSMTSSGDKPKYSNNVCYDASQTY
jgi:hypothetical protein